MNIYTELEIPHQMTIHEVYHTAKNTTAEAAAEYLRQIVEFDAELRVNAHYALACLYSIKTKHAAKEISFHAGVAADQLHRYLWSKSKGTEDIEQAPYHEIPYTIASMIHQWNLHK